MKLPLKYIATLVIVSLVGIFVYQAHWLINMYHTNSEQTRTTILNAIRNADYLELFIRVDSISEAKKNAAGMLATKADSNGMFSFSASFDRSDPEQRKNGTIKNQISNGDTIVKGENRFNPKNIGLPNGFDLMDGYVALELLASQLQAGLHSVVDINGEPIHLDRFDSLLVINLKHAGLDVPHYSRILKLENDSTMASSLPAEVDTTKLERFEYIYDAQQKYAFNIFVEPTNRIVIKQMAGILSTSLFILVVLGIAFWFLIRTIMQQKTLDEMKSDFTNNITHELKTPIAVAYAANDALLNFNLSEDKKLREKYLTIAQEQLQKLSGMVEQILSMSIERRKTFQLKPDNVEIAPLVHSLIEQHKLKAGKPVHFDVKIDPPSLTITTDRTHFSNIISNLIDNAVKYSGEEAFIKLDFQNKDGKLEVVVEDQGIGISPEKQKLIFDKFYRIPTGNRHDVKGYGLGLYYVKTIIERLGGQIEVTSELGKGSIFKIVVSNY